MPFEDLIKFLLLLEHLSNLLQQINTSLKGFSQALDLDGVFDSVSLLELKFH